MNTIGCKICNLRKQNNMSQEQLAEKLNVSRQSISKWERDEALPDIYNLESISEIFGVSIDYLVKNISIDDSPKQNKEKCEKMIKQANTMLIVSIALYFLDVFLLGGFWDIITLIEPIKISLFGMIVLAATILIIYQGFVRDKAKRLFPDSPETK